jgi:aspartate ammonia-lyase
MNYRIDHDLLGELQIKEDFYYGAQTQRALMLCNPSSKKLSLYPELIVSLAQIKKAAAKVHKKLAVLNDAIANAIERACDEIIAGKFDDQFSVDVFNGGGGVSIHMNINEVIANRANEIICGEKGYRHVHPNTHVNMGQSTNDVLPSAMKLALHTHLQKVISALTVLINTTKQKSNEFQDVVKVSRTCLQDAVPMTLGQTFGAHCSFLKRLHNQLTALAESTLSLPLGATAVGTGLGAFKGYRPAVIKELQTLTALNIQSDEDLFDGLQNTDLYVQVSGVLKSLATGISKFAKDLRILSSGPRAGLNEINIAPTQNGSSIMPGKVNPALPELMVMVSYQICGNDCSISMAADGGELELNVWEPIVIINLLESCQLLAECIPVFAEKCIATITANRQRCAQNAHESLALAVVVSAMFGYEEAAKVAKLADQEGMTIKEATLKLGLMTVEEADQLLDPLMLSDPDKSGELLLNLKRNEAT